MEYQQIIDLLDDTTNQPSKFRQEIGMNQREGMIIVKLDLKRP